MMCVHGTETLTTVTIPADLSHTGHAYSKCVGIDSCIASVVAALEAAGVLMRGSCCGHGATDGTIQLVDGRTLVVVAAPPECPDGSVPSPATPILADCWRGILDVRTLNALRNAGLRTAGEVFARSDDELTRINNLGRKGIERIHRARMRMIAYSAATPKGD